MKYLIGVDLGTQGTKTVVRNQDGETVSDAFEPSRLIYPEPGAVEQDPEEMLASVASTIGEAMASAAIAPADVAGICISGQMAGIMGVDADGMAATPYDSWLDTRCGKYQEMIAGKGEERIIELTGAPVTYAHGPKIVWWKLERPDAYKRIHKFVVPAAYCVMRLCGLKGDDAFVDHTYLHFSGFSDTANKRWSDELLQMFSIDPGKMPRIVRPFDVVGNLVAAMAERCGLATGTPVVAGCGDTASSVFGAGVVRSGLLLDVAGTASVFACASEQFAPDAKHKTIMFANSVLDDLFIPYAYINGGGMCLKWFRDDVLGGAVSYEELETRAEAVQAGSEKLLFLPHFSGRVCPNDTLVRGSYINLSWNHAAPHMYRAILEGIAYEYGIYQDIISELIPSQPFELVYSVGGGSKSRLFCQIKADVLGTEVATINIVDTSLLACCGIAGHGVGLYDSPVQFIENTLQIKSRMQPDANRTRSYEPLKNTYRECFAALHGIYSRLQNETA